MWDEVTRPPTRGARRCRRRRSLSTASPAAATSSSWRSTAQRRRQDDAGARRRARAEPYGSGRRRAHGPPLPGLGRARLRRPSSSPRQVLGAARAGRAGGIPAVELGARASGRARGGAAVPLPHRRGLRLQRSAGRGVCRRGRLRRRRHRCCGCARDRRATARPTGRSGSAGPTRRTAHLQPRTPRGRARTSSSTRSSLSPGGTVDETDASRVRARPLPPVWVMAVALVAVAANLRIAITSVPPLLDAISARPRAEPRSRGGARRRCPSSAWASSPRSRAAIAHHTGAVGAVSGAVLSIVVGTGQPFRRRPRRRALRGHVRVPASGSPWRARCCPASSRRSSRPSAPGSSRASTCWR